MIVSSMYVTLAGPARSSAVIKNSEFLGFAAPIADVNAALEFVRGLRQRYPDATHVCWAYRIETEYRFSDDGEPSGTAGAPMYRALETSGLNAVVVAVVRYYGGVNLGAGGLARAYAGTAAEVLRVAERLEVHPRVAVQLSVRFEQMNALYRLLERFDLQGRQDAFDETGLVVRGLVLESELPAVNVALRDATNGRGVMEVQGAADP